MSTLEAYFDEIDSSRVRRIRELSKIKSAFCGGSNGDAREVRSRAIIVLSYAVWEGFYNECVDIYCRFLAAAGRRIADVSWNMLVGALSAELDALRDRNHSRAARLEFVKGLKTGILRGCDEFDPSVVMAKSNLSFERLQHNFEVLDFELGPMLKYRHRIDKELVGWRHGVAHGDSPELSTVDGAEHVVFVGDAMALVADSFQEAMLKQEDD